MSAGFEIARGTVEQQASRMRAHGDDYAAALRRLSERGPGAGSWAGGSLLSVLAGPYAEAVGLGLQAMTELSATMTGTGDALDRASANTRETERAGEEGARRIADLLSGGRA
jgi:hypothetical protein